MNQIPLISRQTADLLNSCLEQLYSYIEAGFHPNEALKKVATERDLLPKQIAVLAYAYNNGIVNYSFDTNDYLALHKNDKLISPDKVIEEIYPSFIKKQSSTEENVSSWYLLKPSEHTANRLGRSLKHASLLSSPITDDMRSPESLEREMFRLFSQEKNRLEMIKTAKLQLQNIFIDRINQLADYFKKADAIHPEEVKKNVGYYYPNLLPIFNLIKTAERQYRTNCPVIWDSEPYSIIREISDLTDKYSIVSFEYKKQKDAFDKTAKIIGFRDEEPVIFQKKTAKDEGEHKIRSPVVVKDVIGTVESTVSKAKSIIPSFLYTTAIGAKPLTYEKLVGSEAVSKAVADSVKVSLIDLMLNDPIISNYEPEDVYKSFIKLISIAPSAATTTETLRILLRKMLTSDTLEPKDILDLVKMETELATRKRRAEEEG